MRKASTVPSRDYDSVTEVQWAYIAGIIDGEGCIRRRGSDEPGATRAPLVGLYINMTDKGLIEWLHSVLGGRVYFRKSRNARHRDVWAWEVERRADVREILAHVHPQLRVKRRRADDALAFIEAAYDYEPGHPARTQAFNDLGMNR